MKISESICIYCGSTENLTKDHVPPINMFPKPRPSTLITVPSCKKCHEATTKDDEYFRNMLCLNQDTGDNPHAKAIRPIIMRSLNRPEASGLKKAVLSNIKPVQLRSQSGHNIRRLSYNVELTRIFSVIERIVRGLFFYEREKRLRDNCDILVQSNDTLREQAPSILEEFKSQIIDPLSRLQPKIVAKEIFHYRAQFFDKDPYLSAWILTFYDRISFLTITDQPAQQLQIKKFSKIIHINK